MIDPIFFQLKLGLTFTVPFMSIPLTAISNMLNGDGLSDMMNFNFGTTAIVTVVILGIILIFVLPQVIYWLTGVNLSAFSWGRSKVFYFFNIFKVCLAALAIFKAHFVVFISIIFVGYPGRESNLGHWGGNPANNQLDRPDSIYVEMRGIFCICR